MPKQKSARIKKPATFVRTVDFQKLLICVDRLIRHIGVVVLNNLAHLHKVLVSQNLQNENENANRNGCARRHDDDVVQKRIENFGVVRKPRQVFNRQEIRQKRCARRRKSKADEVINAVFARECQHDDHCDCVNHDDVPELRIQKVVGIRRVDGRLNRRVEGGVRRGAYKPALCNARNVVRHKISRASRRCENDEEAKYGIDGVSRAFGTQILFFLFKSGVNRELLHVAVLCFFVFIFLHHNLKIKIFSYPYFKA